MKEQSGRKSTVSQREKREIKKLTTTDSLSSNEIRDPHAVKNKCRKSSTNKEAKFKSKVWQKIRQKFDKLVLEDKDKIAR